MIITLFRTMRRGGLRGIIIGVLLLSAVNHIAFANEILIPTGAGSSAFKKAVEAATKIGIDATLKNTEFIIKEGVMVTRVAGEVVRIDILKNTEKAWELFVKYQRYNILAQSSVRHVVEGVLEVERISLSQARALERAALDKSIKEATEEVVKKYVKKGGVLAGLGAFGKKLFSWGALPCAVGEAGAAWLKMCPIQQENYGVLDSLLLSLTMEAKDLPTPSNCFKIPIDNKVAKLACYEKTFKRQELIDQIETIKGGMSDVSGFWKKWCEGVFGAL